MSDTEEEESVETSSRLQARPYQTELLNKAMERNIIVCLGTGTGKTFISVLLIKELAHQIRKEFKNGGKRTFFLVNTVPLVFQQAKVIKDNTNLKIGKYVGEMGVDFWNDAQWEKELEDNEVLVMTAQIFVDLLGHARISLSKVNLIVFDECHHAKKEHPYAQVMKYFQGLNDSPRILGLTASVVNGKVKPYKIESEIQNLEAILRAACETSSDEEVTKFATKPEEIVCFYENEGDDMLEDALFQEVLGPWEEFLLDYRGNSDVYKLAKAIVTECIDTKHALGWSACYRVAECFLEDVVPKLERRPDIQTEDQLLIQYSATQLRQLLRIYKDNTVETLDIDTEHQSPKVLKLIKILKMYGQRQDPQSKSDLCGIIFVERRYTAALLSDLLNRLASKNEQLGFIKCNFVVGHGSVGNSATSHDMSWKKQENILRKFRRHEFNLLIATSVVEEGLDVPKCNLVVRFDFPKTFQSYVQSKGRARAKPSKYIILASRSEDEAVLEMYHAIEEYLTSQCHDRRSPDEEDSCDAVNTDLLPPYKTSKDATLRMSNSISMLNRYCSKLPRDSFTPLYADFNIEGVGNDAFQATVKLPINCPIKKKLKGEVMPSKQQAKMAVAYKACKQLHESGELNDYLLPVQELSSDDDSDENMDTDAIDGQKPKRGTKRSKQTYKRKVPEVFKNSLPKPARRYFLYSFTKKQASNEENTLVKFGILLNSRLPEIRPFIIYQEDSTEVVVSTHESSTNTTKLSKSDIFLIDTFHSQLISELLRIPCESKSAMDDGYYIVPLSWNSGQATIDFEEIGKIRHKSKTMDISFLQEHESLITPHHRSSERFIVEEICTLLNPSSSFPERAKARTYDEYFLKNYNLTTTNRRQPLILVKRFPERINFLVNRKKTKREVKESRKDVHFIPEHCSLHPFSACFLHDAAVLPSILHRITSLLLVEEVIQLVAKDCSQVKITRSKSCQSQGQAHLSPIGKTDVTISNNHLQEWFSSNSQRDVTCVDTFLVLQAITTKGAGDAFDLERLEMLGDAFLKQAVSIHLYCSYQNNHEGKLTKRKVKEISNLNLYKASNRKGLPVFMQNTVLDRKTWLTPSLDHVIQSSSSSVNKMKKLKLDEDGERCVTSEQCISDKSVADSIEALIGAYLISCGYKGALTFLDFLGIKVYPESEVDGSPTSSKYVNFGTQKIIPLTHDPKLLEDMSDELKGFEKSLKYKFQDKMFLLQALTHASHQYNILAPDCYQRLEFLGDAVLDFLVTECLYSNNPNLSPGELTDLRQALVNNNIFAKIAVEHDYHKYLKYTSPDWFRKINAFVLQLEDDRKEGKPQVDEDPFVIMSDNDDGAVEAPKVLGDVFESVAGAVFLDSGMDVVKTWKVYHRMMKPYIDYYSEHVPYNPIRKVHENDTDAKFSEAKVQDGKIYCELKVKWGTFTGKGANKKFAKLHAARIAMDALK